MSEKPKISIITPAYNCEKTILQTVESVLNQSFREFEHIIVDDGSKDSTPEILKTINDARVRIITKENGGASSARNLGIKEAKADIIAFIDSDDLWLKDRLKLDYEIFINSPLPEKCLCGPLYMINEKDEIMHLSPMFNYPEPVWKYQKFTPQFFNPGSMMLNKSIIEKLGYFRTDYYYHEDYDFAVRVTGSYPIIFSPHRLLLYRYYLTSKGRRCLDSYDESKSYANILINYFNEPENQNKFSEKFKTEAVDLCYRTELFAMLSMRNNFTAAKQILKNNIKNKNFLFTSKRGVLVFLSLATGINLVMAARKTIQFFIKKFSKKGIFYSNL